MKNIIFEKSRIRVLVISDNSFVENHPDMDIIPYLEDRDCLWFAVEKNGILCQRINSKYVKQVIY